tara:strand:- start:22 stop:612 length:591 start_codon:yes stop_codon:yes gene_type:complete
MNGAKEITSSKDTEKRLELMLMIPSGLMITGCISIAMSIVLDIFDMEVVGYFLMGISVLISFLILLGNKMLIDKNAQSDMSRGNTSNIFWRLMDFLKLRVPAFLLFGQFISIGTILIIIRDWIISNEHPAIYVKIKRFINLGLFIQFIIFKTYYSTSLKETQSFNFNSAAFSIISLITFSLILYLYVIVKFLTVDG